MATNEYVYPGKELELFATATNWKSYFSSLLKNYIGGDVLEVGAGIGSNTPYLFQPSVQSWTCLEPDPILASRLPGNRQIQGQAVTVKNLLGTIDQLPEEKSYDCILYLDVLEHIEDDHREMKEAAQRLKPGGRLVILAPAYESLMSPFDQAIGHYRRYNRKTLRLAMPDVLTEEKLYFADCLGLLASMANRLLLRQSMPNAKQVAFWNGTLVPVSRILDPLIFHQAGKSILGIWKKTS